MLKLKKLLYSLVASAAILLSGCSILTNMELTEEDYTKMSKSVFSQIVYSTTKDKPETYSKVWSTALSVVNQIDESVEMTPQQISDKIVEDVIKHVNADHAFIVQGILQKVFSKVKIGWSENLDKDKMHMVLDIFKSSIETGLNRYAEVYAEAYLQAVGSIQIPDEMPDNPFKD